MMTILYVYPHPDDESFGPAQVLSYQRRQGHDVHLLTLTRGGATRLRHTFGYTVEKMGQIRYREMQDVARTLDLSGMTVLDLPDSSLKEMDPREIEHVVVSELELLQPAVTVTYPVHGISGFHDHLVAHAAVKRAWVESRERIPELRRLAFHTVTEDEAGKMTGTISLSGSKTEEVDCIVETDEVDMGRANAALDCYVTYREIIEKTRIKEFIGRKVYFEIFGENFNPPLGDLFDKLP